jgi:hypothetical protein
MASGAAFGALALFGGKRAVNTHDEENVSELVNS